MPEKGKANRTVSPDGTVGVFVKVNKEVYERFTEKCKNSGVKNQFKINELLKKFNK